MFYQVIIAVLVLIIIALSVAVVMLWRRTRQVVYGVDEMAEDALKALYHLGHGGQLVLARELIRAADLQPSRYPVISGELRRRKWVAIEDESEPGDPALRITPEGERRALELIRAHRLWERYLADKEGLPLTALHDEAMRREHLTTPEQLDELDRELGHPQFDPHGDPIPTRDGRDAGFGRGHSCCAGRSTASAGSFTSRTSRPRCSPNWR